VYHASDQLERLVSKMTYGVDGDVKPYSLAHLMNIQWIVRDFVSIHCVCRDFVSIHCVCASLLFADYCCIYIQITLVFLHLYC